MLVISTCCLNTWNLENTAQESFSMRSKTQDYFWLFNFKKYKISHYVDDKCLDQKSEYFSMRFFFFF